MSSVHLVIGYLIFAGYFVALVWGLVVWIRRRQRVAISYWWWMRGVAALLVLQIVLGIIMYGVGQRPPTGLHYMYGIILLIGVAVTEMLKPGGSMRRRYAQAGHPINEPAVAAFLGFALWAVALRGIMTGLGMM